MKNMQDASAELINLVCDEIDKNPKVENFLSGTVPSAAGVATKYLTGNEAAGTVVNMAVSGFSRSHKKTIAKVGGVVATSAFVAVGSIVATPVLVGYFVYEIGKSIFSSKK